MWYHAALRQLGFEKDLDLEISLVPHTEQPDKHLKHLRKMLSEFGKEQAR